MARSVCHTNVMIVLLLCVVCGGVLLPQHRQPLDNNTQQHMYNTHACQPHLSREVLVHARHIPKRLSLPSCRRRCSWTPRGRCLAVPTSSCVSVCSRLRPRCTGRSIRSRSCVLAWPWPGEARGRERLGIAVGSATLRDKKPPRAIIRFASACNGNSPARCING